MGLKLEIANLAKTYNGNPVLRDCSFAFDRGQAHMLLGPNGSGKSTLFRILALLEKPDAGVVQYLDGDYLLNQELALRRQITLVLPKTGIFNASVFHNVAYGLKIRGVARGETEARVAAVLAAVGLTQKKFHRALDLSSGETKRLGIARAMVIDPEVFFLDEPTASLDPANAEIIENVISTMKRQRKTTIMMITHDPAQARRLGDQLLYLKDGKIVPF
ncbi:MAG TPA: ATP-binding cassette domain-containing protein [Desulfobaccales bacterium]|jgi:tungstate transport system ATP-binding protein